jgi:hypothetical protein
MAAKPEAAAEAEAAPGGGKESSAAPRAAPAPKFRVAEAPLDPEEFAVVELQVEGPYKVVAAALVRVLPDSADADSSPAAASTPTPSAVVAAAPATPPPEAAAAAASGDVSAAVRVDLAEIGRELPQLEAAVAAVQKAEAGAGVAAALERELQVG